MILGAENIEGPMALMIPIVAIVGGLSIAFAGMYMRNKERMEMISRGMDISKVDWPQRKRNPLRSGLTMLGAGAGLLVAYLLCHSGVFGQPVEEGRAVIYVGFVLTFVGLARLLSHLLEKNNPGDKSGIV